MSSATGSAVLTNIIIIFVVTVMSLLVTSISYTKAFRIKNRIIDVITYHEGDFSDGKITEEINQTLKSVGYRYNNGEQCPKSKDGVEPSKYSGTDYLYCIYTYESGRGIYYKVVSYMYLDLPVIGKYINIPVDGETKVFTN